MIIRLSDKLARKINAPARPALTPHEEPCADWSAHLFRIGKIEFIIFTNTTTLYSALIRSAGVRCDGDLMVRGFLAVEAVLNLDGMGSLYSDRIAPHTGTAIFAKALNRSVTGSMNDLIRLAPAYFHDASTTLLEASCRLNDVPMLSTLGGANPRAAMKALTATPPGPASNEARP
ncbi:MAG: hypothetical protein WD768_09625 [Phycisphaeraceae bacterium]